MWRPNRSLLVMVGLVLILLATGLVFLDVQKAGEEAGSPPPKRDNTMELTIPSMKRVQDVPVYTGAANSESALHDGTLHLEGTGFPWQRDANVYIAGHRLGYPHTKSWLVFWDLNELRRGHRVVLTDSEHNRYIYRVYDRFILAPDDASATKPVRGMNIVTLQTCTLPNYTDRLIIRAELERVLRPASQANAG
ncbi:MAG TPA: class E sortase [Rubrobacter sp.]|nr:class E sortase [Rubrobacter sp.]